MSKKIIVKYNKKTSQITIETDGFTGDSCLSAVDGLLEKISEDEWEETKKEEFYKDEEVEIEGEVQ